MALMKKPVRLKAVAFQEGEFWSAQCLEYDFAAQATRLSDLLHELKRVIIAHIVACKELAREPFAGVDPAPNFFWRLYEEATLRVEREGDSNDDFDASIAPAILPAIRLAESRSSC